MLSDKPIDSFSNHCLIRTFFIMPFSATIKGILASSFGLPNVGEHTPLMECGLDSNDMPSFVDALNDT